MALLVRVFLILLIVAGLFLLLRRKLSINDTEIDYWKLNFKTIFKIGVASLFFCIFLISAAEFFTRM